MHLAGHEGGQVELQLVPGLEGEHVEAADEDAAVVEELEALGLELLAVEEESDLLLHLLADPGRQLGALLAGELAVLVDVEPLHLLEAGDGGVLHVEVEDDLGAADGEDRLRADADEDVVRLGPADGEGGAPEGEEKDEGDEDHPGLRGGGGDGAPHPSALRRFP